MSVLQRTPSVSSVSSGPSNETNGSVKESQPPHRRIPFVRRRLPRDQAVALLAVFEVKTHPTKEEREALSHELGMSVEHYFLFFWNETCLTDI